jgi:hypothetical protein
MAIRRSPAARANLGDRRPSFGGPNIEAFDIVSIMFRRADVKQHVDLVRKRHCRPTEYCGVNREVVGADVILVHRKEKLTRAEQP